MSDAIIVAIISGIVTLVPTLVTIVQSFKKNSKNINDKMDYFDKKLDNHIKEDEWGTMKQVRIRILRFSDDVNRGVSFSEEYWTNILDDIDDYEKFCKRNPDYQNNKGRLTIEYIKEEYLRLKKDNSFLNNKQLIKK